MHKIALFVKELKYCGYAGMIVHIQPSFKDCDKLLYLWNAGRLWIYDAEKFDIAKNQFNPSTWHLTFGSYSKETLLKDIILTATGYHLIYTSQEIGNLP